MQNTRLNSLLSGLSQQAQQFFANPWRRISLLLISLLFGVFMSFIVSSVAGQRGNLDIIVAAMVLTFTEVISWLTYRRSNNNASNSELIDFLNFFKVGLIYGFYLQALILGS